MHFAVTGEIKRFLKVGTGADDRPTDGFARQDGIENIKLERARRQTAKRHGPATAQHVNTLFEGCARNGGYQHTIGTAHLFLYLGHNIGLCRIQDPVRTKVFGELKFLVGNVNGDNFHAHGLGILNRHMAKPADAGNHHRFARLAFGFLKPLIDRDTGTKHRGCIAKFKRIGQMANIVWIGQNIFGKAAIHGIAGIKLLATQCFPAGNAVMAMPAGGMQPRHTNTVALLDGCHAFANFGNDADTFMAGDKGRVRLDRPVAFGGVKVGVTHARCLDLDQNFPWCDLGYRDFFNRQRLAKRPNDGGFHGGGHGDISLLMIRKRTSFLQISRGGVSLISVCTTMRCINFLMYSYKLCKSLIGHRRRCQAIQGHSPDNSPAACRLHSVLRH